MKVKIQTIDGGAVSVDVAHADCPSRDCYWPRMDPGVFVQGRGYQSRGGKPRWLCGTREIRGCPQEEHNKEEGR